MDRQVRHAQKPAPTRTEVETQEVPLDGAVASSLMLATERVTSAQTLLSLRQLELQVLVAQVKAHYEESGAYVVHEVDPANGRVRRSPRAKAQAPEEPTVRRNGGGEG